MNSGIEADIYRRGLSVRVVTRRFDNVIQGREKIGPECRERGGRVRTPGRRVKHDRKVYRRLFAFGLGHFEESHSGGSPAPSKKSNSLILAMIYTATFMIRDIQPTLNISHLRHQQILDADLRCVVHDVLVRVIKCPGFRGCSTYLVVLEIRTRRVDIFPRTSRHMATSELLII